MSESLFVLNSSSIAAAVKSFTESEKLDVLSSFSCASFFHSSSFNFSSYQNSHFSLEI
ncbi:hypothetical protein J5751_04200 [bacterium]|nr:hypothetical protein [bacterium]